MSKEQKDMMRAVDKMTDDPRLSPLTYLFRSALRELKMEPQRWNSLLTSHLWHPASPCAKNAKDVGQERNNFNRAIARPQITARTFIRGIEILGPESYSMTLTMNMPDGRTISIQTKDIKPPFSKNSLSGVYLTSDKLAELHYTAIEQDEEEALEEIDQVINPLGTPSSITKPTKNSGKISSVLESVRHHQQDFEDDE